MCFSSFLAGINTVISCRSISWVSELGEKNSLVDQGRRAQWSGGTRLTAILDTGRTLKRDRLSLLLRHRSSSGNWSCVNGFHFRCYLHIKKELLETFDLRISVPSKIPLKLSGDFLKVSSTAVAS